MAAMGMVGVIAEEQERRAAFHALYQREAPAVMRFARAALGDAALAEDACSEAFCKAWDAWGRFDGDDAAARAWVFRIARNQVVDHIRSSRRVRVVGLEDEHPDLERAPDDAIALRDGLRRLDKDDRLVLGLRAAGLSHGEIGKVQGRSENAVKQAHHRALQRLRAHLGDMT